MCRVRGETGRVEMLTFFFFLAINTNQHYTTLAPTLRKWQKNIIIFVHFTGVSWPKITQSWCLLQAKTLNLVTIDLNSTLFFLFLNTTQQKHCLSAVDRLSLIRVHANLVTVLVWLILLSHSVSIADNDKLCLPYFNFCHQCSWTLNSTYFFCCPQGRRTHDCRVRFPSTVTTF